MKNKISILIVIMIQFSLVPFFAKGKTNKPSNVREKIELKNKEHMVRSTQSFCIDVYYANATIEFIVENYSGIISISIPGSNIHSTLEINNSGSEIINVSQLPIGYYILQVVIGNTVFEGFFEIREL